MNKSIKILLWLLLMFMGGSTTVFAQFNPDNPADPNATYAIVIETNPKNVAWYSGDGTYLPGSVVTVNTSAWNENFTFSHWILNGETVSDTPEFEYTVTERSVTLVAHYNYTPVSPSDPVTDTSYRLFLSSSPEGVCSFNRPNGERVEADDYVEVHAYGRQGYKFLGWFENDRKISDEEGFHFLMPFNNVSLVAKFVYNPSSPDDPFGGNQDDVANGKLGDVNGDNVVDMVDVVALINIYLGKTTDYNLSICDINKDQQVDMVDVVAAINIYLGK